MIVSAPNLWAEVAHNIPLLVSPTLVVHRTGVRSGLTIFGSKINFFHLFPNHEIVNIIVDATNNIHPLSWFLILVYI